MAKSRKIKSKASRKPATFSLVRFDALPVALIVTGLIVGYLIAWGVCVLYWWVRFYKTSPILPKSLTPGTIPAIMYKQGETDTVPPEIVELYRTIESDNPGYRVVYFSDKTRRAFIANHLETQFPGLINAYDRIVPGAYRADLFRYCVLYAKGGLYGDFSQQYLVPLDTLVDRHQDELVMALDALIPLYPFHILTGFQNSFLASRPGHLFWKRCIHQIMKNVRTEYYGSGPLEPTGPILLKNVIDAHPEIQYRMDIGLFFRGDPHFQRLGTYEKVIRHKSPGHYSLMRSGEHYANLWHRGEVYRDVK